MKGMSEEEQEERQRKAWENRDCIRPGDAIGLKCCRASRELAHFRLEGKELVCAQRPDREIRKGDTLHLSCTAITTGRNGYGLFVDYTFRAEETGHSIILNGPDAQRLAERKRAPSVVHNRDIPTLAEILSIMQTVSQIEQLRGWQHDRLTHMTQTLSGMPGGGSPRGLDYAIAALDELDREQQEECLNYIRQLKKAQKILGGIESENMRTFVVMKYVMGCSDAEIRKELNLSRRGFERASRCVENAQSMDTVKWQERYILDREDEGPPG